MTTVPTMPLGDSITRGFNPGASVPDALSIGYRASVYNTLRAAGLTIDFVGSQSAGDATLTDHDHEGHDGFTITSIRNGAPGWLAATNPQIVLLIAGTNDIASGAQVAAPTQMGLLLDTIAATNPRIITFVGTIPGFDSSGTLTGYAATYNAALPAVVAQRQALGQHVTLVQMGTIATSGDHPTTAGYQTIADGWNSAIVSAVQQCERLVPNQVLLRLEGTSLSVLLALKT